MKKIKNAVFVFALFMCFNGCEREQVSEVPVQSSSQFNVEQAEVWFGTNWTGAVSLKSGSIEKARIGIKPDWCNGFTSQNDVVEVVEVRLLVQGRFDMADEDSYKEWEKTKNPKLISSLTRMVFLKYKKDGRIDQFLMTISGDKEYHANMSSHLSDNSYLSREKHFSGRIYYHDLNGNFVNGWVYEKGKLVGKTTQISGEGLPTQLKMATTCITTSTTTTYVECTDWFSDDCYTLYTNTTCGDPYVVTVTFIECPVYFTGSGGPSTLGVRYIAPADGSNGGYIPPAPKKYQSILNHSYLSSTENDLLETALNDLINEGCQTLGIYNSLVNSGLKLDFKMDPNIPGLASYGASSKTMSFLNTSCITSNNIKEELFHAAQDGYYSGGTAQYSSVGKVNIEFEAKLYKDIIQPNCCNAMALIGAPTETVSSYNNWVQYTIQGDPSNISDERYQYFLNKFNQYAPSEYHSQTSSSLTSPNLLKSVMLSCLN